VSEIVSGIISELRTQKRRSERISIFVDGKFALGVNRALAAGLQVGQALNKEQITELKLRDEEESACRRALRLLSRRPRSELELRRYFDKRGVPTEVQVRAMKRLRELGQIDDLAFARAWVENRQLFRPRGRFALRVELRRKGITDEIIETTLDGFDEEQAALKAGRKPARRWKQLSADEFRRRLGDYLTRHGFAFELIPTVVNRLWHELKDAKDESEVTPWKHNG
jgi:regulatory protein